MFGWFGQLWLFVLACCRPQHHRWRNKSLVIGPVQPVDGDSVACTRALIDHLRKLGLEAYTLPLTSMFDQLVWILSAGYLHPACRSFANDQLVTTDLQAAYDALIAVWRPDEIVLVDGQEWRLGFDPRGVPIYRIDHHLRPDEAAYDNASGCVRKAPATGCVLIEEFGIYDPILAVSILTDTFWLRTNMPAKAIESLAILHAQGGLTDDLLEDYQRRLRPLKKPDILLEARTCQMHVYDGVLFAVLTSADPELHREVVALFGHHFHNMCVVRAGGYVSLRSLTADLRPLATKYGGGGHAHMSAGQLATMDAATLAALERDFLALTGTASANQGDVP